jgi:hypothetical protein
MPVYKYYFSLDAVSSLRQARSYKKNFPKPIDFLRRFIQVFELKVEENVIDNYLNSFEIREGENTVSYNNRLLKQSFILHQNSGFNVTAFQRINDDQEKVGNYLNCLINISFDNNDSIWMHWANSSSELALTTEQFYNYTFSNKNLNDIFILRDKFLQLYEATDLSNNIESNLTFLLDFAFKNKLPELAKEIKENSRIIRKWKYREQEWLISQIIDYDGVFWSDKKILWVHSPIEFLNYQLWNSYSFSKLKESEFKHLTDLEFFPK